MSKSSSKQWLVLSSISLLIVFGGITGPLLAQGNSPQQGKISGQVFADYFYTIRHTDALKKHFNGFQYRRFQFTYDTNVSDEFEMRFRLEADEVTKTTNNRIGVFLKDAYLRWKEILPLHDVTFGISPTPAFDVSERIWGYRSVEKTLMDYWGVVSSRDFGIDLRGWLNDERSARYWIKVANNSGVSHESDEYKRYYGLLHLKLGTGVEATAYADFDARGQVRDITDGKLKSNNRITVGGFLGMAQGQQFSLGLEGMYRITEFGYRPTITDPLRHLFAVGISVFGGYEVAAHIRVLLRYDYFDGNTARALDGASLVIAGLDYRLNDHVQLIPNLHMIVYERRQATDVVGRITLAFAY